MGKHASDSLEPVRSGEDSPRSQRSRPSESIDITSDFSETKAVMLIVLLWVPAIIIPVVLQVLRCDECWAEPMAAFVCQVIVMPFVVLPVVLFCYFLLGGWMPQRLAELCVVWILWNSHLIGIGMVRNRYRALNTTSAKWAAHMLPLSTCRRRLTGRMCGAHFQRSLYMYPPTHQSTSARRPCMRQMILPFLLASFHTDHSYAEVLYDFAVFYLFVPTPMVFFSGGLKVSPSLTLPALALTHQLTSLHPPLHSPHLSYYQTKEAGAGGGRSARH